MKMIFIQPETINKPLKKNDEVLAISISSFLEEDKSLIEGLEIFSSWGLTCKNHVSIERHWGYLAGKDKARYKDLHPKNPSALMAFARGGWGAARLLERDQPWQKGWLLGFSDLSSILLSRLSSGFDGAIHGPLINSLSKEPEWSKERLHSLLFHKSLPDLQGEAWNQKIATGPLIATNLTVASHLIGSKHMPDLKGAILVLEDTWEAPYRIDRMLTQWRLSGILQNLAGLAFGHFSNCEDDEKAQEAKSFNIREILQDRSKDLNIPVIAGIPVGHGYGNAALPLGWKATINGKNGKLSIVPP